MKVATADGENLWKVLIGIIALAFFFFLGIACILKPNHFRRRPTLRREGEMESEFSRIGTQFVGIAFVAFAGYVLYVLITGLLSK